jgi:hypothetical protein
MTPADLTTELLRLSRLLDESLRALRDRGRLLAERERDYRLERAKAWHTVDGTAKEREDNVNALTATHRYARDVADHDRQAAQEAVRNYRTQISALQSIANVERAEAEMARSGPQVAP